MDVQSVCEMCAVRVSEWMNGCFSFKRNHLLFYRKIIEMKVYKN